MPADAYLTARSRRRRLRTTVRVGCHRSGGRARSIALGPGQQAVADRARRARGASPATRQPRRRRVEQRRLAQPALRPRGDPGEEQVVVVAAGDAVLDLAAQPGDESRTDGRPSPSSRYSSADVAEPWPGYEKYWPWSTWSPARIDTENRPLAAMSGWVSCFGDDRRHEDRLLEAHLADPVRAVGARRRRRGRRRPPGRPSSSGRGCA